MESILTKKVVYVLKALYYVDIVKNNQMTSVMEIAQSTQVPKRFLEQLFLRLRKADIVTAARGATGGYQLVRRLAELTYRDVVEAIDGESTFPTQRASGQFGEDAFVREIYVELMERTRSLPLDYCVTDEMRKKAHRGRVGGYVYHI